MPSRILELFFVLQLGNIVFPCWKPKNDLFFGSTQENTVFIHDPWTMGHGSSIPFHQIITFLVFITANKGKIFIWGPLTIVRFALYLLRYRRTTQFAERRWSCKPWNPGNWRRHFMTRCGPWMFPMTIIDKHFATILLGNFQYLIVPNQPWSSSIIVWTPTRPGIPPNYKFRSWAIEVQLESLAISFLSASQ